MDCAQLQRIHEPWPELIEQPTQLVQPESNRYRADDVGPAVNCPLDLTAGNNSLTPYSTVITQNVSATREAPLSGINQVHHRASHVIGETQQQTWTPME